MVTEIFVSYTAEYSVYKVVTPYKTNVKVMDCDSDKAVLAALKSTRARNINLITKSKMYELLYKGVSPEDDIQRAIYGILLEKRVTFQRIDEFSHEFPPAEYTILRSLLLDNANRPRQLRCPGRVY